MVGGKLTHPIGLSAIGIFVGNSQHLVGLQAGLQRDISQRGVQSVLRGSQQTGRSLLLIVDATRHDTVEGRRSLVDVARFGRHTAHLHAPCLVLGEHGHARLFPTQALAQLREGYQVTGVLCGSRLVGDPHLYAGDVNARGQVGQLLHGGIISFAEIFGKEEVAVLLVVGYVYLERCHLDAALGGHALRGRVLL